ncbi:MAG: exo-alpha-sialidase [Nitrosomonadales bacterium]|nr:exo-alpha-sialidase [Nitrosomonadales bacterium]
MALPVTRGRALLLALIAVAFSAAFYKSLHRPEPASFQLPAIREAAQAAPEMRTRFVSSRRNIATHAASLVELGDGRIRAFWFAGSKEGAEDVTIQTAVFDPVRGQWGEETSVTDRDKTQRALLRFVKKLGNPVALRAADGTLWLYYVTVSVGGWAGSSITAMTSNDDGATWSTARRLVTSPFINISTLVKGAPFLYDDGSIGLPAYHEFIGKFGELLRIAPDGSIIDKQRLSSGKLAIQPVMLIQNPQQAMVVMRHTGAAPKRVIAMTTNDAGRHWSTPAKSALANPDAAVAGVALPDGRLLMALNDTETNREVLSLAASADGGATWQTVYRLEDQRNQAADPASYARITAQLATATDSSITDPSGYAASAQRSKCAGQSCGYEFSYPYLIQAHNGDFHLVYTWNRSFIKHVRFTRAWLDQQMKAATHG